MWECFTFRVLACYPLRVANEIISTLLHIQILQDEDHISLKQLLNDRITMILQRKQFAVSELSNYSSKSSWRISGVDNSEGND